MAETQRRETETERKTGRCPWPSSCSDPELELGLGAFPPLLTASHVMQGMAGRGAMVAGGRAGGEPTGSFLPKLGGRGRGGRRGAFYKTRASGLETSVSLQISEETFASPEGLNHTAAGEEQALAWRLQMHSPVLSGTWS